MMKVHFQGRHRKLVSLFKEEVDSSLNLYNDN